jgi:hypothetical protein
MTEQETFTTRLRRHRERSRTPLADIARDTRVKLDLLEGLEKNDLAAWPRGLYARAYVRAYAAAIGLDGDDTVNEFCRLFPHGDRRAEGVIREPVGVPIRRHLRHGKRSPAQCRGSAAGAEDAARDRRGAGAFVDWRDWEVADARRAQRERPAPVTPHSIPQSDGTLPSSSAPR